MDHKKAQLEDIRLFLSPIHRLVKTFTPPDIKRIFDIEVKEPFFIFGSGPIQAKRINSTDDFVSHIENEIEGIHFVGLRSYDLDEIIRSSIKYGMTVKNGQAHLDIGNKSIEFTIQSNLAGIGEHLTNEKTKSLRL